MSNTSPHVNPLFAAAVSPPTTVASRAVKFGGCGGIAVAAWLFTAVATGYGYAAADESADSTSSSSSSSSSISSSPSGASSTGAGGDSATESADAESTSSADAQSPDAPAESEGSSDGNADADDDTDTDVGDDEQDATEPDPAPAEEDEPDDAASPLPPSDASATPAQVEQDTPPAVKHSPETGTDVKVEAAHQEITTPEASPPPAAAAVDDEEESDDVLSEAAVTTVPTVRSTAPNSGASAAASASAVTVVAPAVRAVAPTGLVGMVNAVVTKLLDPFLAPAPSSPEPLTPALWAVLGWVRRNLFNEAPTLSYDSATTVQTGQTVTGTLGGSDAEHDALTYTVVRGPKYGTVTIDQATGTFTYTPNDIDYDAAQTDSFTVSVTDGRVNLLSAFGQPHRARADVDVTVLNPTVSRVIMNLPGTITSPANPRYAEDGKSIYFAAQPTAGGRSEIYQIGVDGTDLQCVTCGVTPSETGNLAKPVPVNDGSGRVLVLVQVPNQSPRYSMLENGVGGRVIVPISTPAGGGFAIDKQREMRVSPDGKKVLFTRIVIGPNNLLQALPIVGTLNRTATGYEVVDARVVYPTGEGKQWTPDGKGVLILGGQFDAGNVDDIEVDLATGTVTRVTANLDYDEDLDMSPNEKWIAIGSTRGLDALTPMTRIVRQNFLPVYVGAPVYLSYAVPVNVSNQEWAVALEDELKGENGIPLFDTGDGYAARSMPSWNATGDAVTFWESSVADPSQSRLVIANLRYTTSVGPVDVDRSTPNPSWAPNLSTYVPTTTPLPAVGSYTGPKGGSAVVTEEPDPIDPTRTIRTVTYTNYVNSDGMILNGTESADYNASQVDVHYLANVTVTGTHTGSLTADATINAFQQSLSGHITSVLDGDRQDLPDPAAAHEAQQNA